MFCVGQMRSRLHGCDEGHSSNLFTWISGFNEERESLLSLETMQVVSMFWGAIVFDGRIKP